MCIPYVCVTPRRVQSFDSSHTCRAQGVDGDNICNYFAKSAISSRTLTFIEKTIKSAQFNTLVQTSSPKITI